MKKRGIYGLLYLSVLPVFQASAAHFSAEIVRTEYGVPHITARDYGGLGFGQAYAYAQDNLCLLADRVVTVRGERAKFFGPEGTTRVAMREVRNLDSDFYFRAMMDGRHLQAKFRVTSPDYQALVRGAAAGFNRYLRDTPSERRAAACRNSAWVREITVDDVLRMQEDRVTQVGAGLFLTSIANAAPPSSHANVRAATSEFITPKDWQDAGWGSNGWAFGRDVTTNGKGLLVGNPHYPWETINRFYQAHLTIPGKLDAMGATLGMAVGLSIGFNRDVAWTHTVSTDRHFTLFQLTLDPANPTSYIVDGKRYQMSRKVVSVEVSGAAQPQTRTFYSTIYGPVLASAQTPWTTSHAFALRDANRGNMRHESGLDFARAHSVRELLTILNTSLSMTYVNTIAADRNGEALYADITATPNISSAKLAACTPQDVDPQLRARGVFVLDGSRSSCNWDVAKGTPEPGLMPAKEFPFIVRTDYVANSNDSYWLASPRAPMPAYSPIIGPIETPLSLRSRAGILTIERRLSGADGRPGNRIDLSSASDMLYENRDYAAELVLDELLLLCDTAHEAKTSSGNRADLRPACEVLRRWDRRFNPDSVGGSLFKEFWAKAQRIPNVWATPFNPKDPANTPRGLNTSPETAAKVLVALTDALDVLRTEKLRLDAPYGEQHFAVRGRRHIPVPGGDGADGVLNNQVSPFNAEAGGYVPYGGSSYIQFVTFDDAGPVAKGILTYSLSTDPDSPHFADQTELHSRKQLYSFPFNRRDVIAHAIAPVLKVSQ